MPGNGTVDHVEPESLQATIGARLLVVASNAHALVGVCAVTALNTSPLGSFSATCQDAVPRCAPVTAAALQTPAKQTAIATAIQLTRRIMTPAVASPTHSGLRRHDHAATPLARTGPPSGACA